MKQDDRIRWQTTALDLVFDAIAASETLSKLLVFKGARILNILLDTQQRQSLDIDSNILDNNFGRDFPSRQAQAEYLQQEFRNALSSFFQQMVPQSYVLKNLTVKVKPRNQGHPRGWNAFEVRINLDDLLKPGVRGLPVLTIDIAAPEELLDNSLVPIKDGKIQVYRIERIAGEKLRAFLSSLPAYRRKLSERPRNVRAKDLYDIARIMQRYQLRKNTEFWYRVSQDFHIACKSRFVDCKGLESFAENLPVTRKSYIETATIPDDITFEEAWAVITKLVVFFEENKVLPFDFPLKSLSESSEENKGWVNSI